VLADQLKRSPTNSNLGEEGEIGLGFKVTATRIRIDHTFADWWNTNGPNTTLLISEGRNCEKLHLSSMFKPSSVFFARGNIYGKSRADRSSTLAYQFEAMRPSLMV
jgi:hypothetical protein